MRHVLVIGALLVLMVTPDQLDLSSARAEELTPEQQEAVRKAVQEYLREREGAGGATTEVPPPSGPPARKESKSLKELSQPRDIQQKYGSTMEGSGGLIYARPFVAAPKAIVGGYADIEYWNMANDGTPSYFDQHRLVPFIYGDVSDHVKFATEIEFEHGGVNPEGDSEIKVEFATIDYLVKEPLNLRAGILLLPLGKFNLLHDSPLRDLTQRPIVDQRIIPTTLHQPGLGFYGTLYPTRLSQLYYEAYVTSGFTNAFGGEGNPNPTSNINNTNGIRSARNNSTEFDNNNGKSVVGRLAFSPILGVEVGGSGFFGSYDPQSKRPLAIWALDWTLQRGPFEIIGESAWAYVRDNQLQANGVPIPSNQSNARRMQGYYVQLNYHFLPEFLTRLAPSHFRPEVSTFTGVVRWEQGNLGQDLPDTETGQLGRWQQLSLGINFRPLEDTVFKFAYKYTPEIRSGSQRIHDNGVVASAATYF